MISSKVLRAAQHQSLKASQYRNERLKRPTEGKREDVKEKTLKCELNSKNIYKLNSYSGGVRKAESHSIEVQRTICLTWVNPKRRSKKQSIRSTKIIRRLLLQ